MDDGRVPDGVDWDTLPSGYYRAAPGVDPLVPDGTVMLESGFNWQRRTWMDASGTVVKVEHRDRQPGPWGEWTEGV